MASEAAAIELRLGLHSWIVLTSTSHTHKYNIRKDVLASTGKDQLGAMADYVVHRDGNNKGKNALLSYPSTPFPVLHSSP